MMPRPQEEVENFQLGADPARASPNLFSTWLGADQAGMGRSRRAHPGIWQGACQAAIPSPHALSRNSSRGQGSLARCQRAPSALGPPGPSVPARLPKLTLAGPAHTPPFWALRSPPRRAMLAPNTPEPWTDCGMGSTSGQSLGKRFLVPAPARAHPCL